MENPLCKDWCTRDELVKLSLAKPGLDSLTTPELTEVLRGKKQKAAHGVESHRVEGGDILWRLVVTLNHRQALSARTVLCCESSRWPVCLRLNLGCCRCF